MGHNENKDNNSYIKDNKKEKFKVIAKESIEF